jgi:5-methylcytosine-specific restriction endonuclease McrA
LIRSKKLKSKRAKATDITKQVKLEVWERDKGRCVVCGNFYNVMPNAHVVPRSKGGMGIPTNIVTLCTNFTENRCHHYYDNGTKEQREKIDAKIVAYMKQQYGNDWNKEDQIYKKYKNI